jgi:dTDP-4-dehydrorhamnose 3,5-epimerase
LHYQVRRRDEKGQGKLLRCVAGRICQVSVDMREESPTLGQWSTVILDGDLFEAVWVPPGFANGFYTFERGAVVHYEMTAYHEPELCRELSYRCPMVGIKWPMGPGSQIIASPKDRTAPFFDAVEKWK